MNRIPAFIMVAPLAALLTTGITFAQEWHRDEAFAPEFTRDQSVNYSLQAVPDARGGFFLHGSVPATRINGEPVGSLVRLDADGVIDPSFQVGHQQRTVAALAPTSDGGAWVRWSGYTDLDEVYVTPIDPPDTYTVQRLRADGSVDPTLADIELPNASNFSALPDDSLIVWGSFTEIDHQPRSGLARIGLSGGLDPLFNPAFDFDVINLSDVKVADDGRIFVRGRRSSENDAEQFIIRLSATGDVAAAPIWTNPVNVSTDFYPVPGGFVVRRDTQFDAYDDAGQRLHSNYQLIPPTDSNLHRSIRSVEASAQGHLFVELHSFGGETLQTYHIVELGPDLSAQRTLPATPTATTRIHLVAVSPDGKLLLREEPNPTLYPAPPPQLQLADGTQITSLNLDATRRLQAQLGSLHEDASGRIMVTGSFTHIDGQPRAGIARFMADGALDAAFAPSSNIITLPLRDGGAIVQYAELIAVHPNGNPELAWHWGRLSADGQTRTPLNTPTAYLTPDTRWLLEAPSGEFLISAFTGDQSDDFSVNLIWLNPDGTENRRLPITIMPAVNLWTIYEDDPIDITEVPFPRSSRENPVQQAVLREDNHIIVVARPETLVDGETRRLFALDPAGVLDEAYEPDVPTLSSSDGLWLTPQGGVIVLRRTGYSRLRDFEWVRLHPDGARDPSFAPPPDQSIHIERILRDGRIAGYTGVLTADGWPDLGLAAYANSAGNLLTSDAVLDATDRLWLAASGAPTLDPNEANLDPLLLRRFTSVIAPTLTASPGDRSITAGEPVSLAVGLGAPSTALIQWFKNDMPLPGETSPHLVINRTRPADAGNYTATVTYGETVFHSEVASITVSANTTRLVNFSARSFVTTEHPQIGGFVTTIDGSRPVLLRAIGQGMAQLSQIPFIEYLPEPELRIFEGGPFVRHRDIGSALDPHIESLAAQVGAFPARPVGTLYFPERIYGSALAIAIGNQPHTAMVTPNNGEPGLSLFEFYDAGTDEQRVVHNVSLRGWAGRGHNVLTAGFVITGTGPARILVRAIGPSLAEFGVTETVSDPAVRLFRGSYVEAANQDWSGNAEIQAAASAIGAFELAPDSRDAAVVVDLPAGAYTAQVDLGDSEPGEALLEIYLLEPGQ
ncbi:hypothetical protein [Synoicihabitans lomoniglobus]|uniref:Ig-like domain-containing protein n=1 Tax=Synoicihabitans lomoniglobus TaxID=2909285 RepID=A0AAF0CNX8_9BACT|nr:hypothetical protein [Opitutaceae bacterium LMO-M01]WED63064.1 hypothetical protein PXH66_12050 [Opitutaceae bacterium LMO-M01]